MNVAIDEFAFVEHPDEFWAAVLPVATAGHRISIASTPFGIGDLFHQFMTTNDNQWSKHKITFPEAVEQGLSRQDGSPQDVEQMRAMIADEDKWQREYLAEFSSSGLSAFDHKQLQACLTDAPVTPKGSCYIGVDIARTNDYTAFVMLDSEGNVTYTDRMRGTALSAQIEALATLVSSNNVSRVLCDKTSIGQFFLDEAQKALGVNRVEGLTFTNQSKLDLVTALRRQLADKSISIPREFRIHTELETIRRTLLPGGSFRFDAPSTKDGHADAAWALMLAVYASANEHGFGTLSVPNEQPSNVVHIHDQQRIQVI